MMIKTEDPSYIVDIKNPVGDGTPCNIACGMSVFFK